jgi:hypothetical protein
MSINRLEHQMDSKLLSESVDGMSQSERVISFLRPDDVKIDDRDVAELLKFLSGLSAQFNYYDFSDQVDGNWEGLFKSDMNTLMALISKLDVKGYSKEYARIKQLMAHAKNEAEALRYFKEFLETVRDAAGLITQYAEISLGTDSNHQIAKDFSTILKGSLQELGKLRELNLSAGRLFGEEGTINLGQADDTPDAHPEGQHEAAIEDIFGRSHDVQETIQHAVVFIDQIFSGLKTRFNQLQGVVAYYLKSTDLLKQSYEPHLGLLISFLHLYTHLQEQLNGFTEKHLDFYYQDVLGISPKHSHPDSIHLLFEPSLQAVRLETGEKLMARIKGVEKPLIYGLQKDLVVTRASVAEMKTVYISDADLFSGETEDTNLRSAQVYCGDYPVIEPAKLLKGNLPVHPWPVLGEDQSELAAADRTMEDAAIGMIAGSPLLYLPEGQRSVSLIFKFDNKTFEAFSNFISDFAKKANKTEDAVVIEMLSDAFTAQYTAIDGWQPVKKLWTRMAGDHSIEMAFTLDYKDKGIDVYNPLVHGQRYHTTLPMVRLLLNNRASHNPFSFLRDSSMEQFTIKTKVKGFRSLKLQNNIGSLSSLAPFQLFGPQPSVGSYLDIGNANVFNRFTKDFTIRLDWLDLPRDPGGFSTYYEGYDAGIENDSFKVSMSASCNGKFNPDPGARQSFQLFETTETEDGTSKLDDVTEITGIELKKIAFPNDPPLKEEPNSAALFKEGVIRLTLTTPPEAFGGRLFPQIFPKIVLYNSKRFHRDLPIPNQPFIPQIKAISVDYCQQHTEVLSGTEVENASGETLYLIHQYPFGFKAFYPESEGRVYPFIPAYDYPNNLYIGIKDLSPGQELSLLFQLEERNFHHTVHKSLPVIWSYLYQNTWIPLEPEAVLQDGTNSFINTGIVRLKIPYSISRGNTILNPALYWIRASTMFKSDVNSRVIAIYANAVTATRMMEAGEERKSDLHLPGGSVTGFVRKMPGIQSVWQLFPSFGGKGMEKQDQYRGRISERLRHKQRPLTMQDIEQFVLNEFPGILMVKCFGAGTTGRLILPGINMQVILIPKEQENGCFTSDEPKVNLATLYRVKQFLVPFLSPFIKVEVGNPIYEKVKVVCKVKFNAAPGVDTGHYLQKLNQDIKRYICTWLYQSDAPLKIGATIYLSDMLNFIKNLPYISVVTGFSMVHFFQVRNFRTGEYGAAIIDSAVDNVSFLRGSVPEAVLIPSEDHLITVMKDLVYEQPMEVGIGSLPVGSELSIASRRTESDSTRQPDKREPEEYFRLIINHHID